MENEHNLEITDNFDSLYWSYNVPLQMWPIHKNEKWPRNSSIAGWRVLNYMPRKERCSDLEEKISPDEMPTYCRNAAKILRNLANRFEKMAEGKVTIIYYPDDTEEE